MCRTDSKGFTLIEVLVAAVVLLVVITGALSYQYYAAKQKKIAWAEMTALRTAQMVIEDWKSTGGRDVGVLNGYTPSFYDKDFIPNTANSWKVTIENLPMLITLSKTNVKTDTASGVRLDQIRVLLQWRSDFSSGNIPASSPSIDLRNYVRSDSSGG